MILAYAAIFLIVLALIFKRDLNVLAQLPYRGNWKLVAIILGLFALQWGAVVFVQERTILHMGLLIASHLALATLFLFNRRLPGAKLFALGIILNTLVMIANGGWMPVTPETAQFVQPGQSVEMYSHPPKSKNIIIPRSETKLWLLSDNIPVTLPWRRNAVSIGDILMIAAIGQFLFQPAAARRRSHNSLEAI
jgi:hypothetical protein